MLNENDARELVEILAETIGRGGDHSTQKRRVMRGLCRLIDADAWVWTMGRSIDPGAPYLCEAFIHDGSTAAGSKASGRAAESEHIRGAIEPFFSALNPTKDEAVGSLPEMDREALSIRVGQALPEEEVGPLIAYWRPLEGVAFSAMLLYRLPDRDPFDPRQCKLAEILLSEVSWLHRDTWAGRSESEPINFSPRQRMVFKFLLQGWGRKAIGMHLGLSENTVAAYTRDIYRVTNVQSQPDLMRKFLTRNARRGPDHGDPEGR